MKEALLVSVGELEGLRSSVRQIRKDSSRSFRALPPHLKGPSVRLVAERLLKKTLTKFVEEENLGEADIEMLEEHLRPILYKLFEEEFSVQLSSTSD